MSQMIFGLVITKAIYCVAKLNIADILGAEGPMNCSALADKSGAHGGGKRPADARGS